MPNENAAVCGCSVVLQDLPKASRNGMTAISTRNFAILIPKNSGSNGPSNGTASKQSQGKRPGEIAPRMRGPHSRASDSGSTSSVAEQTSRPQKSGQHRRDRRANSSRRSRSAERAESHYTYIDSVSSVVGSDIRESAIAEAVYCTIDDEPDESDRSTGTTGIVGQQQVVSIPVGNRSQQPVYAIPSMTSPPPTYDVATAKSWQTGLPPSYEEYLCHKRALLSRSHTPPPPWTDSSPSAAEQQELRECLAQLVLQSARKQQQAARPQRTRAMPPRSQSESRAHQQRVATMYEDGAFCMETTVIQSALENGVAFCSLM